MAKQTPYPSISDYAFIADSNSTALVSRAGSIDWCCIKRIDANSCFGRLLDWEKGGYCSIHPAEEVQNLSRDYLEDTLVLETVFQTESGEVRLLDFYALPASEGYDSSRKLLRIVEGVRGHVEMKMEIAPRFDYGGLSPWLRREGHRLYSAIGGDDGLLISSDADIETAQDGYGLEGSFAVRAGERVRLSILSIAPENLDRSEVRAPDPDEIDQHLQETIDWWRQWISQMQFDGAYKPGVLRSAIALKGLSNERTGAIAAAGTTSLPEAPGGELNWDYRYSWIRDSYFSVQSLAEIGFVNAADGFRRFVERSAAGSAREMEILYGVGGERRLGESVLGYLEGYRQAQPVRVGNAAVDQLQLGIYGEMVELSWRWHLRGNSPGDDYWRFLAELIDIAAERWSEPDSGIWEARGNPQHFVHSKVMCWTALEKGLKLAEDTTRRAPTRRWEKTRDEIRDAVESEGYDKDRGIFTRTFGTDELDAALLLLPQSGFLEYDDERMIRTADAIQENLGVNGLLKRYAGDTGAFLACSFWLSECLARQGRVQEAQQVFDRTLATGNDLGLYSEMYDTEGAEPLGNFPQGLTHFSHIAAAVALTEVAP